MSEAEISHYNVQRKSSIAPGFEVELKNDGFYYVSKVPPGFKAMQVGDLVLEINGAKYSDFQDSRHANELIDSIQLSV